ncbi:hypothetical protein K490DRAFT_31534 [Saccharata proteae CBS 121410]|uniref:DM2 domain-containing protein n=1 Tax=Saccharata proteae CBS 121410 TaxID=1314787 RepID=A0A9P4I545_9PEZI|nr:hypothetical protein K490DRAFT_31534 [Saccharata proteae CBS 121410]
MIRWADLETTLSRNPGPMVQPQHPPQMTAQQLQQQQVAEQHKRELARRQSRKPTDKNIPDGIEDLVVGDGVQRYRALRDVERKLDAIMMRKRLDINDSIGRNLTRYRTLRIWVSNTAENQPWQQSGMDSDAFDFGSESQATYRVKIEGRLLDDEDEDEIATREKDQQDADAMDHDGEGAPKPARKPMPQQRRTKLSHFFKSISIDFDRSRSLQPDGYTQIEWRKPENAANAPSDSAANFDTLEFERKSDENINVTINLFRDETPERFKLSKPLAELLGTDEEDRAGIMMGIWNYIRANNLQEDEDSRKIRCDERLKAIFDNVPHIPFPSIQQAIVPHLSPLPPLQLPYTIRVDQSYIAPDDSSPPSKPTIYDVLVPLDDPLRALISTLNAPQAASADKSGSSAHALQTIAAIDEQLALVVQALQHSKSKHAFFNAMAADPVRFVKRWVSSQQRDLEVLLGEAGRGGGEDATGVEWRKGGDLGIWGGENAREGVGVWLARMGGKPGSLGLH